MQIGPEKKAASAFTVLLRDCAHSLAISGLLTVHNTFQFSVQAAVSIHSNA